MPENNKAAPVIYYNDQRTTKINLKIESFLFQKEQTRDQSLGQLEATLHRKSAECRALIIGKDTLQNKIDSLEKEVRLLFLSNCLLIQQTIYLESAMHSCRQDQSGNPKYLPKKMRLQETICKKNSKGHTSTELHYFFP